MWFCFNGEREKDREKNFSMKSVYLFSKLWSSRTECEQNLIWTSGKKVETVDFQVFERLLLIGEGKRECV